MKKKGAMNFWASWKPVSGGGESISRKKKNLDIWHTKKAEINRNLHCMRISYKLFWLMAILKTTNKSAKQSDSVKSKKLALLS